MIAVHWDYYFLEKESNLNHSPIPYEKIFNEILGSPIWIPILVIYKIFRTYFYDFTEENHLIVLQLIRCKSDTK